MSYSPRTWVDRQVERPKTYNLQENGDGSVTLLPAEGIIIEAGTPLIADNMNHIEEGLDEVSTAVGDGINDYVRQPAFAVTAGSSTAYTVTLDPAPNILLDGFGITIVPHVTNGANATLNINGLGGYPLKKQNGLNYPAGRLVAGKPYSFRKVGPDFLADSAGGNGDAVVTDVRAGKKFTNDISDELTGELPVRDSGVTTVTPGPSAQTLPPGIRDFNLIVSGVSVPAANVLSGTTIAGTAGSMPNRGAIVINPGPTNQSIPNGYHNGSGYVQGDSGLTPPNIRSGVSVFGVTGSLVPVGHTTVNASTPGAGAPVAGWYELFRIPAAGNYACLMAMIYFQITGVSGSNVTMAFYARDTNGMNIRLHTSSRDFPGSQTYYFNGIYLDRANRKLTTAEPNVSGSSSYGGWSQFNTDMLAGGVLPAGFNANGEIIFFAYMENSPGGGYTQLIVRGEMVYG